MSAYVHKRVSKSSTSGARLMGAYSLLPRVKLLSGRTRSMKRYNSYCHFAAMHASSAHRLGKGSLTPHSPSQHAFGTYGHPLPVLFSRLPLIKHSDFITALLSTLLSLQTSNINTILEHTYKHTAIATFPSSLFFWSFYHSLVTGTLFLHRPDKDPISEFCNC